MPVIYEEQNNLIFAYPQIRAGGSGKLEVSYMVDGVQKKEQCNGIAGYLYSVTKNPKKEYAEDYWLRVKLRDTDNMLIIFSLTYGSKLADNMINILANIVDLPDFKQYIIYINTFRSSNSPTYKTKNGIVLPNVYLSVKLDSANGEPIRWKYTIDDIPNDKQEQRNFYDNLFNTIVNKINDSN